MKGSICINMRLSTHIHIGSSHLGRLGLGLLPHVIAIWYWASSGHGEGFQKSAESLP